MIEHMKNKTKKTQQQKSFRDKDKFNCNLGKTFCLRLAAPKPKSLTDPSMGEWLLWRRGSLAAFWDIFM